MAKQPPREHLPGNDGRWYLELVGVVEPEPESTDTYATLERLVPPPVADDTATITTGAASAAVNGALVADNGSNGELVPLGRGGPPLEERRFDRRWGWAMVAVLVAVVVAGAGGAAYVLPRAVERDAAVATDAHRAALVALRNELPNTQAALDDLTDPDSNADAVSGVPIAVAELSSTSGLAISVATTPLPSTLPLVPRASLDALGPTRSTMTILGATGRDLAGQLGTGFSYRTTIESLFNVDILPTEASDDAITDLSIELAADLAETGRLVAELPPEAMFTEVRELAAAASQRYALWQLEYLDALHEGDADRAVALVAELQETMDTLHGALTIALAALRTELDPLIVELAAELETAIDAVPE